ncbi:DUF2783 domain-containing protein [Stappia sp.]|uniref:DUF2783 domain-containing protein n=1 Tax=Stappia sp. TaxID=1870903 RepID=UPI003D102DD5
MTGPAGNGLRLSPNIADPDGFYAELIALHEGLTREDSEALNARLVLVLANHVGDRDVLHAAFAAARTRETAGG